MINKKNKENKKLPIILITITILLFLMYLSLHNKYLNSIKIYFHNIGSSIQELLLLDKTNINEEIVLGINNELEKENNELKKLLELKENNYQVITALVIKRNIDWYQTITINKGKKDGIDINMAVTDSNGLIGKIKEVGNNYSIVELITSNLTSSKVAVDIKSIEDYHGILSKYDKKNNLIIIDNIIKNSEINIDDKVYTNGLGGVYPSGIYIGKVVEITYDELGINKIVKVKPDTNYDNIRYVNVIGR